MDRFSGNGPGKPPTRLVPGCVKNNAFVLFQLCLLWRNALLVFSPTLKIYFALSKVRMTVGSVSDEMGVKTEADQFIEGRLENARS